MKNETEELLEFTMPDEKKHATREVKAAHIQSQIDAHEAEGRQAEAVVAAKAVQKEYEYTKLLSDTKLHKIVLIIQSILWVALIIKMVRP